MEGTEQINLTLSSQGLVFEFFLFLYYYQVSTPPWRVATFPIPKSD